MKQLEFDFSDEEPTQPQPPELRKSFEFVGTTSMACSFDPAEFVGMSVPAITEEILLVLSSIAPGVNFFHDDIVEAASGLAS